VLDSGGDDVLFGRGLGPDSAENGQIIRLRPATQEDNFFRAALQQSGRFPARGLQPLLGQLAFLVDTGRISRHLKQRSNEDFEYNRRYRRRCVVIKVETRHFTYQFNSDNSGLKRLKHIRLPVLDL
jgi:hypothetical protein